MDKNSLQIKIGSSTWLKYVGFLLLAIGILLLLVFVGLWVSGKQLPDEIKFVYIVFVIGDTLLSTALSSLLFILVGNGLINFKIYQKATLILTDSGGLIIQGKSEALELKKWQIGKVTVTKSFIQNNLICRIKLTTSMSDLYLKINKASLPLLRNNFEHKIKIKNVS